MAHLHLGGPRPRQPTSMSERESLTPFSSSSHSNYEHTELKPPHHPLSLTPSFSTSCLSPHSLTSFDCSNSPRNEHQELYIPTSVLPDNFPPEYQTAAKSSRAKASRSLQHAAQQKEGQRKVQEAYEQGKDSLPSPKIWRAHERGPLTPLSPPSSRNISRPRTLDLALQVESRSPLTEPPRFKPLEAGDKQNLSTQNHHASTTSSLVLGHVQTELASNHPRCELLSERDYHSQVRAHILKQYLRPPRSHSPAHGKPEGNKDSKEQDSYFPQVHHPSPKPQGLKKAKESPYQRPKKDRIHEAHATTQIQIPGFSSNLFSRLRPPTPKEPRRWLGGLSGSRGKPLQKDNISQPVSQGEIQREDHGNGFLKPGPQSGAIERNFSRPQTLGVPGANALGGRRPLSLPLNTTNRPVDRRAVANHAGAVPKMGQGAIWEADHPLRSNPVADFSLSSTSSKDRKRYYAGLLTEKDFKILDARYKY